MMVSFKLIFVVLSAALLCCAAGENSSFSELLDATMLEMGMHKLNQTILADAKRLHTVPMADELFLAGSGVKGSGSFKKAKKMTKDPSSHIFEWTGDLTSGNILFVRSKTTWKNSIVVRKTSLVREGGTCTKCGADAELEVYEETGAVPLSGPTTKGKYKVVVDLEQGTVSYKCADMCWPYTKFGKGLFIVGSAVCGEEWDTVYKKKKGPEMTHDKDSEIYRATVHMCPHGSFRIFRKSGSPKKSLGLMKGAWQEESTPSPAKGGFGYMTQFRGDTIPSPPVEGDYEVVVDMVHGTVEDHCVGDNCGPNGGPSYYVPENQVNETGAAFVHLFGWRWRDIALECESFLGPKGYKAVQIQPPQESKVPRPGRPDSWNYGYRPVSYKLNSKYGSEVEFKEMIERCKYAGVDIYADAVINHMGGGSREVWGKGSGGTPFQSRDFPDTGFGSYLPEDFHHNKGDTTTNCRLDAHGGGGHCDKTCSQTCDFNGMPDLDTSSSKVQGILAAYLNHLLDLGVAGFRVDASDHIGSTDLKGILENVEPKFRFFEARDDEDMKAKMHLGRVTQFRYKNRLMKNIMAGTISKLKTLGEPQGLVPSSEAVVFVVNHDQVMAEDHNGEGITYKTPAAYTMGNVVMLSLPYGYPKVISSFYFPSAHGAHSTYPPPTNNVHGDHGELRCGDNENWVCEHRWPAIANMIRWRKYAGENLIDLWESVESSQVYFCRGKEACILINAGENEWTVKPKLALAPGDYCNIIESDDGAVCPKIRVDKEGNAQKLNEDGSTSEITVPGIGTIAMHTGAMTSAATE